MVQRIEFLDANFRAALNGYVQVTGRQDDGMGWAGGRAVEGEGKRRGEAGRRKGKKQVAQRKQPAGDAPTRFKMT